MKFLRNLVIGLSVVCILFVTVTLGSMEGTYYYQRYKLEPVKQLSAVSYSRQLQEVIWVASSETGEMAMDKLSMTSYVYRIFKGFGSPVKDPGLELRGSFVAGNLAKIFLNENQDAAPSEEGRLMQFGAMSVWVTKNYTITEAMDALIDQSYFGQQTYGADNAAELYFGKPVGSLGLSENLVLGALFNMPDLAAACRDGATLTAQAGALLEQLKVSFPASYDSTEFVMPQSYCRSSTRKRLWNSVRST